MPETPEQLYERAAAALRMPLVEGWDTFPFEGQLRTRSLRPPAGSDPLRSGSGGIDCKSCAAPDEEYLWTNNKWRVVAPPANGLPVVVLLETREHYAEPGDLSEDLARDLGVMLTRLERAVRSVGGIGRVHVCRWGDGSEHLHWWFMGRPARMPQLIGSFAAIWDDVLPQTPDDVWQANVNHVVAKLSAAEAE